MSTAQHGTARRRSINRALICWPPVSNRNQVWVAGFQFNLVLGLSFCSRFWSRLRPGSIRGFSYKVLCLPLDKIVFWFVSSACFSPGTGTPQKSPITHSHTNSNVTGQTQCVVANYTLSGGLASSVACKHTCPALDCCRRFAIRDVWRFYYLGETWKCQEKCHMRAHKLTHASVHTHTEWTLTQERPLVCDSDAIFGRISRLLSSVSGPVVTAARPGFLFCLWHFRRSQNVMWRNR